MENVTYPNFGEWSYQDKLPELNTATVIGITVAIAGNVLISLALNIQKLAHNRLDAQKNRNANDEEQQRQRKLHGIRRIHHPPSLDESHEDLLRTPSTSSASSRTGHAADADSTETVESQPLLTLSHQDERHSNYGSLSLGSSGRKPSTMRTLVSRLVLGRGRNTQKHAVVVPVEIVTTDASIDSHVNGSKKNPENDHDSFDNGNESDYLKSKLWWSGFLLMNVGEVGNFISYAWAPASVVAPLGTFALIANCVFAPLMIGERFRKRDIFGIFVAIIGAITVVLSSNASNIRLDPEGLLKAIKRIPFLVYSCIYIVGIIILATLSESSLGRRWVFVDVGLCALFGGFTVLSTKAISTLLTMEWFVMFTQPITYPVLTVLLVTGVGQIRYLNRALMRFDSKTVIPIQFVLFNLSAIVGSAILYGDFEKANFHQIVTFLYGCSATFAGVFIIAWESPHPASDNEEHQQDAGATHTAPGSPPEPGSPVLEDPHYTLGSLSRRRGATLVLPGGTDRLPLRRKSSGIMGLSPAQPLLLVHTPPRELPSRDRGQDGDPSGSYPQTPESGRRLRGPLSWVGEQSNESVNVNARRSRQDSLPTRNRNSRPGTGDVRNWDPSNIP